MEGNKNKIIVISLVVVVILLAVGIVVVIAGGNKSKNTSTSTNTPTTTTTKTATPTVSASVTTTGTPTVTPSVSTTPTTTSAPGESILKAIDLSVGCSGGTKSISVPAQTNTKYSDWSYYTSNTYKVKIFHPNSWTPKSDSSITGSDGSLKVSLFNINGGSLNQAFQYIGCTDKTYGDKPFMNGFTIDSQDGGVILSSTNTESSPAVVIVKLPQPITLPSGGSFNYMQIETDSKNAADIGANLKFVQ